MKQELRFLSKNGLALLAVFVFAVHWDVTLANHIQTQLIGTIRDETQTPLQGVSVQNLTSTTVTTTDEDGRFFLQANRGDSVLVRYIGYEEVRFAYNDNNVVIDLQPSSQGLDEVVVVGYGTLRRKELTSAAVSVKAEDFRQGGARNAMDLIQGKVAGFQITRTSGANPNSGVAMQIRGATSLIGSTTPLVIIDGVPGGNLDLLMQEDIETIDVLKDGSAAAIYGTQANGGVILVTTKKGRPGPTQFEYATYFRKEYLQRVPDFMNAAEYRQRIAEGYIAPENDRGASVDAFDQLINHDNMSQYHTLSVAGGSEKNSFRASGYFRDLQGIARENSRQEYGLRANFNGKGLQDRLTTQVNFVTNFNKANLLGGGGWEWAFTRNPTQPLKNEDGTWYYETTTTNEVARLEMEHNNRDQQTSSVDAKVGLQLIDGLTASAFGSVQRNAYVDGAYRMRESESSIEDYYGTGYASRGTHLRKDYAFEPTLDYQTLINNNHSVQGVLGYSYRYSVYEGFSASNYGFVNDIFEENNLNAGSPPRGPGRGVGSNKGDHTTIAFFGRVNYAYKGKYLFQAILRREGSSRFGVNNKWGNFPAVSAGWTLSEEDFLRDVNFVDFLKLRVGYGVTGNSEIGNYNSLVTLGTGGYYIHPGELGWAQTYGPNRNPNPNLRWEKKGELNIGVDYTLLGGRLGGAIDWYRRETKDLLESYTTQQPPFVRDIITTNVGTLSSTGIELTINAVPVRKGDFTWNTDVIFSHSKNVLESFSNDVYKVTYKEYAGIGGFGALGNAILTREGGRIGDFYGKRFAGFDDEGKFLFYNRFGEAVYPAELVDSKTDPANSDFGIIGNAVPKYYASWNNTFRYKNFDLRVFLRGKFDYDILNTLQISYGNRVALPNNLLNSAFDRHAELGDTYMYSDYYLESGSHVKLDELTLGYTFRLKTPLVRNLRVYFTGQNLATITGYTGNDPDFISDIGLGPGVDGRGPYPSTQSFLVGLNIGF